MVHRPCAAPGLGIDAALAPGQAGNIIEVAAF